MATQKKVSSFKIILMGELIVNIPVTAVIIIVCIVSNTLFDLGWFATIVLSSGIGWVFWDKLIAVWVKWARRNGAGSERLFRLSKLGLINFYKRKVDEHYS
jgi:hypothetical protein